MRRLLLPIVLLATPLWPQPERILDYALEGSNSCKKGPCWNMIDRLEVQRALLAVAQQPRSAADLIAILGGGLALRDLETLRLVRRDGESYRIGFALLQAADVQRMRERAEVQAQALAGAVLARRPEIERILDSYGVGGVDRGDVAFIVLGCFSLDWDGLKIVKARRYLAEGQSRPDGKYTPWALERVDGGSRAYHRSSSSISDGIGWVSFGDGSNRDGFLSRASLRDLIALRDGESLPPGALASFVERGYVDGSRLRIPVFSRRDADVVAALRRIGRESLETWLATGYAKLKADLSDIAPVRAGVPFEEAFNPIYHEVFGRANAKLVDAGMFADPHAAGRRFRGYTPAVFDARLTR